MDAVTATEAELPLFGERLIGASCTLSAPELRARLSAWRELVNRAQAVESVSDGVRLVLPVEQSMADLIDLVVSESECCAFYTFTVSVEGPDRRLDLAPGLAADQPCRRSWASRAEGQIKTQSARVHPDSHSAVRLMSVGHGSSTTVRLSTAPSNDHL